jgi:hypothetical protein
MPSRCLWIIWSGIQTWNSTGPHRTGCSRISALTNSSTYNGGLPKEVAIEDEKHHPAIKLIQQFEDGDRSTIFKLVDKILTNNKKFKEFYNQNVAAL